MENIKRACVFCGVSVVAPVETRTTQSAPFMRMTDSQDSRNEPRKSDYVKFAGLKFQGKVEYIDEMTNKLRREVVKIDIEGPVEIVEKIETVEIAGTIETVGTVGTVEEVIGVILTQVQKMIDIGLEVEIVLEVDLEVEEGLSRTIVTAINQIMIGLIVIDIPKT